MTAPTLQQMNDLPDLIDTTRYLVKFGTIPGYSGSTEHLALKCFNGNLPGRSNERFETPLPGGHTKIWRGRNMFPRTISFSFYEDRNFATHQALFNWLEFMGGTNSGNSGGYQRDYAIPIEVDVYDTVGAIAGQYQINYVMPMDIPDTALNAESSTATQVVVQFSYETAFKNGVQVR